MLSRSRLQRDPNRITSLRLRAGDRKSADRTIRTACADDARSLLGHIHRIEGLTRQGEIRVREKVAVFDLDNTLLDGDLGEAVFAQLWKDGHPPSLTWTDYQECLREDVLTGYCKVVTAMDGLPLRTLVTATHHVLSPASSDIEIEGEWVPVPHPNPRLLPLLRLLRHLDYRIILITSTNEISARIAVSHWFGAFAPVVFGLRPHVEDDIVQGTLIEPLPLGEGKVDVYRRFVGNVRPLLTAGNSIHDLPFMRLTHDAGCSIWVGNDEEEAEIARRNLGTNRRLFRINAADRSEFEEHGADS